MRISDADRQRAIEELARHLAAGRLDLDGYAARLDEVWAAQTLADVDRARRDLPFMRIEPPPSVHPAGTNGTSARGRGPTARRWRARIIVALTIVLVVVGFILAVTSQVVLIIVLVVGWLIGMAQGRATRSRR